MITACPAICKSPKLLKTLAVVGFIFGAVSVVSGGQVVLGPEENRIAAGDFVPFVVWFNFFIGFAYMASAVGLYRRASWGAHLAITIAAATALVFAAFGVHIFMDGAFEARTVGAMVLRTGVWIGIACVARQGLLRKG